MDRNQQALIISGIVAFLIYFLLLFVLLSNKALLSKTKYIPKTNTSLDHSIAIDIGSFPDEDESSKNGGTPLEGLGIKDIFSSIPDDTQSQQPQNSDNRSIKAKNTKNKINQAQIKALQEELQHINSNLKNIQKHTIDSSPTSSVSELTKGEYDEWFAKIYDIIYKNWNIVFYQNAQVKVLLHISSNGFFDYQIIEASKYEDFNQNILALLESLKKQPFPPSPNQKAINIEVNLINEGIK